MGRFWDGLGRLGDLLAVLGAFKIEFFQAMIQAGLQEASGIDFGRLWIGFGRRFWEALGAPRGRFGKPGVELASHLLRILQVSCCTTFATGTPALPRYAPWSVTMRGFLFRQ